MTDFVNKNGSEKYSYSLEAGAPIAAPDVAGDVGAKRASSTTMKCDLFTALISAVAALAALGRATRITADFIDRCCARANLLADGTFCDAFADANVHDPTVMIMGMIVNKIRESMEKAGSYRYSTSTKVQLRRPSGVSSWMSLPTG